MYMSTKHLLPVILLLSPAGKASTSIAPVSYRLRDNEAYATMKHAHGQYRALELIRELNKWWF
jgi:hypothetical protein